MHYYKRNIGDYNIKAGRLNMLQHGAYTLLMDACYDREKFPTKEQAIEWAWACSDEEIAAVEFVLAKFFTLENGVYIQNRIAQEVERYQENSATNKRIANEREAKRREDRTNRARSVDEAPPNYKLRTKNQELETKNQELETKNQDKPSAAPLDYSALNFTDEQIEEAKRIRRKNNTGKAGTFTQRMINSLASEVTQGIAKGWTVDDMLTEWEDRGWKGFKAEWLTMKQTITNQPDPWDTVIKALERNDKAMIDPAWLNYLPAPWGELKNKNYYQLNQMRQVFNNKLRAS